MISIIVPVYNAEPFLIEAVESVRIQEYSDWELILVDDGSTDGSLPLCRRFAEVDPRIRVFHQENGGASAARNEGLRHATGEFVLFLDSDDCLAERALDTAVMAIGSADLGVLSTEQFPGSLKTVFFDSFRILDAGELKERFVPLYSKCFFNSPWGKVYRKDKICIGFPEDICLGEDLLFNLTYLKNVSRIAVAPAVGYRYRVTPGSQTRRFRADAFAVQLRLKNAVDSFFDSDPAVCRATADTYLNACVGALQLLCFSDFPAKEQKKQLAVFATDPDFSRIFDGFSAFSLPETRRVGKWLIDRRLRQIRLYYGTKRLLKQLFNRK